jgi:hypothetical protein
MEHRLLKVCEFNMLYLLLWTIAFYFLLNKPIPKKEAQLHSTDNSQVP